MSKERARLDMACMSQELIIIALRKQAKELERAELARCAEECEKQSEYEGGLLDRIAELEKTCKSRSDTIIEYSNKIAEFELSRKELIEEFAEAECMGDLAKIARNYGYEEQGE